MSESSMEGDSPANKRGKADDENTQKVQDFVKKLEEKQAKKAKFTKAKISFPPKK